MRSHVWETESTCWSTEGVWSGEIFLLRALGFELRCRRPGNSLPLLLCVGSIERVQVGLVPEYMIVSLFFEVCAFESELCHRRFCGVCSWTRGD